MKAIILAAGEGTRLRPLSINTPKPLIKIFGKPIIEHNIENIYHYVDEILIVVKYKKELIKEYFGDNYKNTTITYIEQGDDKGTGAALRYINKLSGDIIVLNGDSIFHKNDLEKILLLKGYGALCKKVENPEKYGVFMLDENGNIKSVVEKPEEYIGDLINIGVYKFNASILDISKNIALSIRGEYEITDIINIFIKDTIFKPIEGDNEFIDIGYPWDILSANKYFLLDLKESKIEGIIEDSVQIKGNIILGKGSILKSGTYIEGNVYIGENTEIGPGAYLRGPCVIGNNAKLGKSVEVKNCYLGDNSKIPHLSYFGDSVIGNNVNIGCGSITANLRHDGKNIKAFVKGELIDTGLRKLGVIIGDNTKLGIKTLLYPGRILNNDSTTIPGEIVK